MKIQHFHFNTHLFNTPLSKFHSRHWLIVKFCSDNFGDHKKIDNEISELRFKFGSGYRIYYTEIDNIIVLLINGGDKSTQSKDILKAKSILQEWRNLQ